jgi:hypothetical protein
MPELKLGNKFDCYSCGTKFYDLGKPEPICPKCGANQKDATQGEGVAAGQSSRRRRKADIPKAVEIEEEEPIDIGDEEMVGPVEIEDADIEDEEEEEDEDFGEA